MEKKAVLTAIGKDRPGIVAAVTGVLYEIGCNLEGSSMTLLQGYFAMILILSYPEDVDMKHIRQRFSELQEEMNLFFTLSDLEPGETTEKPDIAGSPFILNVIGVDHPGIVHQITSLLATWGVNITDVNTRLVSEDQEPVYIMVLELDVPNAVDSEELLNELREVAKGLKVDVSFNSIETFHG